MQTDKVTAPCGFVKRYFETEQQFVHDDLLVVFSYSIVRMVHFVLKDTRTSVLFSKGAIQN